MVQIENYIQSFLNGTLDAEGHVTLKQWIKEAPENRTYFHDTVAVWKAGGIVSNADDFNVEKAISKFKKENKSSNRINFYSFCCGDCLFALWYFFSILFMAIGENGSGSG